VIGTVAAALVFDAINGFHDAANSIATVVSTRVLSPRTAVLWAAFFNFVAMFVFAPKVADTISKIVYIQQGDPVYVEVVLAGLMGAIAWDLLTWWWSLPTSSSHALIGGFAGAGIAFKGWEAVHWDKLWTVMFFIRSHRSSASPRVRAHGRGLLDFPQWRPRPSMAFPKGSCFQHPFIRSVTGQRRAENHGHHHGLPAHGISQLRQAAFD
jgi:hypothetical protein